MVDFRGARQYALTRLKYELPSTLYYHSLWHTQKEVIAATEQIAARESVGGEALMLMRVAVYFHDVGFVQQRMNHEYVSADIAARILPHFGFGRAHIQLITGMIAATKLPQTPKTHLEEIVADADLDVLGREDFLARNLALRDELAAVGVSTIDTAWYGSQVQFMQQHRYFTAAAREMREAQKQQNIADLIDMLHQQQALNMEETLERASVAFSGQD
jgi:uncharacterized protein